MYRGVRLFKSEISEYTPVSITHLAGYTSTSLYLKVAIKFARKTSNDPKLERVPVVFKIRFTGSQGLFKLSGDCTNYPWEEEVLV